MAGSTTLLNAFPESTQRKLGTLARFSSTEFVASCSKHLPSTLKPRLDSVTTVVTAFKNITENDGLQVAMRWLNARVPYRFTAVFAFDGDMLRNVCFVDKEHPDVTKCIDQPILDSYCTYVHRSGKLFSVERASTDGRVVGHPKRGSYQCYYGVPLFDTGGKILGTVCHFDILPQSVNEDIATTLDDVAPVITEAVFEKK
jgi:hypothetical protein